MLRTHRAPGKHQPKHLECTYILIRLCRDFVFTQYSIVICRCCFIIGKSFAIFYLNICTPRKEIGAVGIRHLTKLIYMYITGSLPNTWNKMKKSLRIIWPVQETMLFISGVLAINAISD